MNAKKKEELYIAKRRFQAFLHSVQFYLCRVFPIKKNRIAVCTFEGRGGFGCNPKYIAEELHRRDLDLEIVWLVNDMSKQFPEYVKKAPNTNWSRAYWLSTSKIWLDNYRTRYGTKKRKGQYYLNTNHYTVCIKRVGLWRGDGFSQMAYLVSKADSEQIDDMLGDSLFCDEMYPKGLLYKKQLKRTGAPRCDALIFDREAKRERFRKKYHLPEDARIVMYAPTFREGAKNGKRSVFSEEWSLDFKMLLNTLSEKFSGQWYLCLRVHPQLADKFNGYNDETLSKYLIDESKADDMYEVLAAMDVYITDYSSACFEAGYAKIPVFLYIDDLESYIEQRGGLFWDYKLDSKQFVTDGQIFKKTKAILPFSVSQSNDELQVAIREFDRGDYEARLDCFHKEIGYKCDEQASIFVVNMIEGVLAGE